jgi:hypothetical protein
MLGLVALSLTAGPAAADDFFESRIRPVLVEHCLKCHSAEAAAKNKLRGGLLLDTKAGWQAGGDTGPALVPGDPAASLLLKSLRYDGDLKMPPAGKLPDAVVADFEAWIKAGAADPRTATAGVKKQVGMSLEDGRNFWAYKPIANPAPPAVADPAGWVRDPLDRFVLAKQKPAPDAAPQALLRRVYFDLVGLPPPPDAVARFAADPSPAAYTKIVDELLASPGFGDRWGRHWLDVARFAESVTLRGMVFPEAWRYRDYVIDAFNRDRPFDRFVVEQLAGDLLPAATPADRARQLTATGFLMLGNHVLEEQDKKQLRMDVVDEQLDVIGKGLLGQTITCARCHDHKFDPIPTKDYYALAGILRNVNCLVTANVSTWTEVPLPAAAADEAKFTAHEAQVAALERAVQRLRKAAKPAAGPLAVAAVPGVVVDDAQAEAVGRWKPSTGNGTFIGTGFRYDDKSDPAAKSLTFRPALPHDGKYEVRLAYYAHPNRSTAVPVTVFSADGDVAVPVDMTKPPPLDGRFVRLGTFRFEAAGQSFVIVRTDGAKGHVSADAVAFVPVGATDQAEAAGGLKAAEAELKKLKESGPRRPKAMAPVEEKAIEEARVHVRGSVHSLGEPAPRGVLRVAGGPPVSFPKDQSGRLELARWIAHPDNPLTARVFVNRVWHWLFGAGIVKSVDNFGTTGEPPTNPELLDHLASRLVADGWSVKTLVRAVVLSHTYQQAGGRRRLDAECLRDALLSAAGTLDPGRGGPSLPPGLAADYGHRSPSLRRSVYLPQLRNSPPELVGVFDPADPSTVTGARSAGTVAPQALYLLNSPFVRGQAEAIGKRIESAADPAGFAYRLVLSRDPTAGERRVADAHRAAGGSWADLAHALVASAEFRAVE